MDLKRAYFDLWRAKVCFQNLEEHHDEVLTDAIFYSDKQTIDSYMAEYIEAKMNLNALRDLVREMERPVGGDRKFQ